MGCKNYVIQIQTSPESNPVTQSIQHPEASNRNATPESKYKKKNINHKAIEDSETCPAAESAESSAFEAERIFRRSKLQTGQWPVNRVTRRPPRLAKSLSENPSGAYGDQVVGFENQSSGKSKFWSGI